MLPGPWVPRPVDILFEALQPLIARLGCHPRIGSAATGGSSRLRRLRIERVRMQVTQADPLRHAVQGGHWVAREALPAQARGRGSCVLCCVYLASKLHDPGQGGEAAQCNETPLHPRIRAQDFQCMHSFSTCNVCFILPISHGTQTRPIQEPSPQAATTPQGVMAQKIAAGPDQCHNPHGLG